ncbi:MAG: aminoacyl-tRNA hydrolase [Patescibacteria group bacterium]
MAIIIAGLGNPDKKYEGTRHNVGRDFVSSLQKKWDFSDWKENKKTKVLESFGAVGKMKVLLVLPQTYMNESGTAVLKYVTSKKGAEKLLIVHDDLDLPLGGAKISFNRGSGGHRGVLSVAKQIKTEGFGRFRVGISPSTPSGKLKKPTGEEKVLKFVLGKFSDKEEMEIKKVLKKFAEASGVFVEEGIMQMMTKWNGRL